MDKKDVNHVVSALKGAKNKSVSDARKTMRETDANHDTAAVNSGHMTARQRINALFDEGTFVEMGAFVKRRITDLDTSSPDEFESVICGYGSIDSRLVYVFAQDFSRTKGAVSEAHAKKICSVYRLAIENGAPVIGIFDSAGALLCDGVKALAGYGSVMAYAAKASGVIPQIAVVSGSCTGSAAVIASMFDFIVRVKDNGAISVNAPFQLGKNAADDFAESSGLVALDSENETSAAADVRRLIAFLPLNNAEGTVTEYSGDDASRIVDIESIISESGYDVRKIVAAVADNSDFIELYPAYAPEIFTGFISIKDTVVGIVANQPCSNDGKLTCAAARKAAKTVSFCDCFNIPVVSLIDCGGLDVSIEAEKSPYGAELAKLAGAYASASAPLITVVTGKAHGTAFTLFGSKAIGADIVFALNSAKIGPMSASSAVAFLWNDKIGSKDSKGETITRQSLENDWDQTLGSAVEAAYAGEIDDVIESSELRARIGAAVSMLASKSKLAPSKRHANLPL